MAETRNRELESLRGRVAELEHEHALNDVAFQTFMERASFGVHRYSRGPGGRLDFIWGNDASARLLGVDPAPLVGKPMEEAFPMLADSRLAAECARLVGSPGSFDEVHIVRTGQEIASAFKIYASQGRSGEVLVFFHEATENVRMQAALSTSEMRLSSIFQAVPVGIGLSVHRIIREANDHMCQMTGYSREELIGKPTRIFYADDAEYERTRHVLSAEEDQVGRGSTESRWMRKDGRLIDVLIGTAPLIPGSKSAGVTFSLLDITERKRAEAERRELEDRLRQAQKLESLGVLAGGIAHDFNNILMAVLGHARLAEAELPPAGAARANIQEIQQAARRAADLCRQMLAYAGKGRFEIQALDVNEVVTEMQHMLEVSIARKSTLRLDLSPGLPAIRADVAQVRQVLMNLVINASEAMGESAGIISISTDVVHCDRAWLAGTLGGDELPEGPYVRLAVRDTGAGMDETTRGRIFEPFYTTKFTGRGLGLAAVLGIVRGHQGAIRVESCPGSGSTFSVILPPGSHPAQHVPPAAADQPQWRGKGLVLLVDDEDSVRAVGSQMLGRLGFQVLPASDGRQALDLFARHRGLVVCAIVDLTMPCLDSEETVREIRALDPRLPVILSSGYDEQEAVRRFSGQGLAGFLHKPYELGQLQRRLREALAPVAR